MTATCADTPWAARVSQGHGGGNSSNCRCARGGSGEATARPAPIEEGARRARREMAAVEKAALLRPTWRYAEARVDEYCSQRGRSTGAQLACGSSLWGHERPAGAWGLAAPRAGDATGEGAPAGEAESGEVMGTDGAVVNRESQCVMDGEGMGAGVQCHQFGLVQGPCAEAATSRGDRPVVVRGQRTHHRLSRRSETRGRRAGSCERALFRAAHT